MALVEVKRAGDLGIMVLNNGKYNQLSADVFGAMDWALDELSRDSSVKTLVLAANPGPVFCSGADVNMIAEVARYGDRDRIKEVLTELHTFANRIDDSEKPVIAAVSGVCFGGGFELSLACDYIVASPLATFSLPEVSLGIIPGLGGTQRLPRRIGMERAMQLMLTGERISAQRAADLGIVDKVIGGDFIAGVKAFSASIYDGDVQPRAASVVVDDKSPFYYANKYGMGRSANAVGLAADAAVRGAGTGLKKGLDIEMDRFVSAVLHPDAEAGIRAFLTKTKPSFEKVIGT